MGLDDAVIVVAAAADVTSGSSSSPTPASVVAYFKSLRFISSAENARTACFRKGLASLERSLETSSMESKS